MKLEFSKKLLMVDYLILAGLFAGMIICPETDFVSVVIAWIAQVGISSAAYYWKAKNENRTKVPLKVIESLPTEVRDQINLTEVITTIIQSD